MLDIYYQYRRVIVRFRSGALGNEIDSIAARLYELGYKYDSAKIFLSRIARFSKYAARRGCTKSKPIEAHVVDQFLRTRVTPGARWTAQSAIAHAKRSFPERFAPRRSRPLPDPHGPLLAAYLQHLLDVRGLHPKTCEGRILGARRMLVWQRQHLPRRPLSEITAKHVLTMTRDLMAACSSDGAKSSMTSYMRSFLRFLHFANRHSEDFSRFVPTTPCWRLAHLPPRLAWEDVRRAIEAIEINTPSGIRDRAMMLLLASTGLRNRELRDLELEDIRWRTGELLVRRAKGHRDRLLPMLQETGAALAKYVLHARPKTSERRVFLSHLAPVRPFISSGTVSRIVRVRLQRAGIPVKRGGAHLLRHSLATRLVTQGRPIKEVADLLGHQHIDTTAIYVKVALPQLADVALPFPGGGL
jgi:integrase/recombinase XerD